MGQDARCQHVDNDTGKRCEVKYYYLVCTYEETDGTRKYLRLCKEHYAYFDDGK